MRLGSVDQTGTRRSRILRFAVCGLALIGALGAFVWLFRQPLVQHLLVRQLRELGLQPVALTVDRIDAGRLELRDLRIGEAGDLEIESIEVRFSAEGLFDGRLDSLRISTARLRAALGDQGITFGALDALIGSESEGPEAPSMAPPGARAATLSLPFARAEIEDVVLELATLTGPLEASLSVQLEDLGGGRLEATADMTASHKFGEARAHLNATGSPEALEGVVNFEASAAGDFDVDVALGGVSLSGTATLSFRDGEFEFRLNDCSKLQIESYEQHNTASLSMPLDLCLTSGLQPLLRLTPAGSSDVHLEIRSSPFAVAVGESGDSLKISGELPALRVWAHRGPRSEETEFRIETGGGQIELSGSGVGVRNIQLEASRSADSPLPQGRLRILEIFDIRQPARFANLSLDAAIKVEEDRLVFAGEIADRSRKLRLGIDAEHDTAAGTGRAKFHLEPLVFGPEGVMPSDLIPLLTDTVRTTRGSVEGFGSVQWNNEGMQHQVSIALRDLSLTGDSATIDRLNAPIEIRDFGTPPSQLLSVARIDFGVELTNGLVSYQLHPDRVLEIESAIFELAGGSLSTSGEFDPQAQEQNITLDVKGIDLGKLLELVNLDGLSGSGTLDGQLPLRLAGGEIEIRSSVLRSLEAGGLIQYRPEENAANLGAAGGDLASLLDILADFHFEKLEIQVDGNASGSVVVKIQLEGSNPAFENGRPASLNLSVDARLADLIRAEAAVAAIPNAIEEDFRAIYDKAR